ncbi:MAG: RNA polymerase sigma factor [Fimbriimonadales bacterium]
MRKSRLSIVDVRRAAEPALDTVAVAFEELISAHLDALYRTALRLCAGITADAEDLLHDAVLKALERHRELRKPESGKYWLFTILIRTNLNRIRSSQRRRETLIADYTDGELESALADWQTDATTEQLLDQAEIRERLTQSLDRLDEGLREVVWLTDVEGFGHREVGNMLHIPAGTVASRLFRARRALRRDLRDIARETGATRIP